MKTKEEVLAIGTLSTQQRQRAEAFFQAAERFGKPQQIEANNVEEVKRFLNGLQARYEKRKAAEARKHDKEEAEKNEIQGVINLVKSAQEYGFTVDDVLNAVRDIIRERKNAAINAQIEALRAQLIQ